MERVLWKILWEFAASKIIKISCYSDNISFSHFLVAASVHRLPLKNPNWSQSRQRCFSWKIYVAFPEAGILLFNYYTTASLQLGVTADSICKSCNVYYHCYKKKNDDDLCYKKKEWWWSLLEEKKLWRWSLLQKKKIMVILRFESSYFCQMHFAIDNPVATLYLIRIMIGVNISKPF